MDIRYIRDARTWAQATPDWNELLARSALDLPFLRAEFLQAWWKTLGGGEWPDGDLWVAIGQDASGNLQAAAPLFRTKAHPASLALIGTSEIADYLDVLCPPETLSSFAASLLQAIERGDPDGVETLDLWNVLDESPTLLAFEEQARARGWRCKRARLKPAPIVRLRGGWDAYLARLDKKQRHELRRKMRRAAGHPDGATFTRVSGGAELPPAMETFLGLMATDDAKAAFLTPPMRMAFHDLAAAAAEHGWLRLEFMNLGHRPVAAYFCFDYAHSLWIYNSGLDPAYQSLSPGWALLGHLIQSAADEGKAAVDFLRGEEEYKIRLGGVIRYVGRLTLSLP